MPPTMGWMTAAVFTYLFSDRDGFDAARSTKPPPPPACTVVACALIFTWPNYPESGVTFVLL